jgi:cyclophilin family peptidyl-prolyl cis-trans isomerase
MSDIIHLYLKNGLVKIKTNPSAAPNHVAHAIMLVKGGYYDGLKWHRVTEGFMAQTGCCYGNGSGGANNRLRAEFNDTQHVRGTVSAARAQDPDTASAQFFICFAKCSFLDGNYTAWGEVIEGMEFVDAIKKGDPQKDGMVEDPDRIIRMVMAEDDV